MTDAVQVELIRTIPNAITALLALVSMIASIANRAKIKEVHAQLNSVLSERVTAAESAGRISERTEQRAADAEAKKP
jgi:hypothetical protein